MNDLRLGAVESRFADIIWNNEPLSSRELVEKAKAEMDWNKSTTYTVLRRLCEKGIFKNEDGAVTSLISKEEFIARQSEQFVEDTFDGSLPAFLSAFTSRKQLSDAEVQELIDIIKAKRG